MLSRMRMMARLGVLVGTLLVLLVAVGGASLLGLRRTAQGLETVYLDRVVPLRDLKEIADAYAVAIVDTAHKVRARTMSAADGSASVSAAAATIRSKTDAYRATRLVDRERTLVADLAPLMLKADEAVSDLLEILQRNDWAALVEFAERRMYPAIDPVSEKIGQLVELQLDVAKEEFERAEALFVFFLWLIAGLSAVAVIGGGAFASAIGASISRPVARIVAAMQRLAKDDLSVDVPGLERKDEIGDIAASVAVFKAAGGERRRLAELERTEASAKSARTARLLEITGRFEDEITKALGRMKGTVSRLHESSDGLSASAEQTQRQSEAVSAATRATTDTVATVSTAGSELSSSVSEIARQVDLAARTAASAATEADAAKSRIESLARAAEKIGEIVSLINAIAGQTNLLALNATIESARAGEAGRGFAVVAQEVKSLAGQTAGATDEIARQIAAVQAETGAAVAAIGGVHATIAKINELSAAIAGAVQQQGAATAEIARNVEQASRSTLEVAENIAGVASAAGETGKMAETVYRVANKLLLESHVLQTEVEDFLKGVRAA
ncbi:MAG: MCP four helix bundle domain-containing protein [Alphaproteobacteria bacterium]|nr:MCP four helix bundle domain-containing protein [Alphaproteobacteria bacterium]